MKKGQLARLLLALAAVIAGALYLLIGESAMGIVLAVMCVCFTGIAAVAWREARAAGAKGFVGMLPAIAAAIVAGFALIGCAVYFAG